MSKEITFSYNVSGHIKIENGATNETIIKAIKLDFNRKVRGNLSSYDLDYNSIEILHDSSDPPFVFVSRTEYPHDFDSSEFEDDDLYYDYESVVAIHFPTKIDLNLFKIKNQKLQQYINCKEEIRINL